MTRAVIAAARRTPIGRIGGALAALPVEDLAAPLIGALLADAGLDGGDIDDVILGNAAGPGGNPARVAALAAGLPLSVPGVTVDRQCGSGLEAVVQAARLVQAGAGDAYIAGGVESPSTAPVRTAPDGTPMPRARFSPDSIGDPEMGQAAEAVARHYGISRARQDAFALASHQKAVAAQAAGRFTAEIVPVAGIDADECPRADTSLDALAKLPPVFAADGTVTAGNACPINDGAAAVLVLSEDRFRALGLDGGLAFEDAAAAGVDPNLLGIGPVAAARRLCARRPDLDPARADLVEFNEAFAAQALACLDELAVPPDRTNVGGGALALGHPWGASGAVLVCRLFSEIAGGHSPGAGSGQALIGIGGGIGIAAAFTRV